ncbi:MAG: 2-C-methyl-D-erythritol 4-phosphate cytidylyltransferase [Eubacteriales bacterium]|nr:2-C-methyl-D-erythritol 4-phosphate cytidylyltransferase [Eubacteriales bacterium]
MIYAAILAGGSGSRFGSDIPKQFLNIDGKPVLIRSIAPFFHQSEINQVLTLCPSGWTDQTKEMVQSAFPNAHIPVLPGGSTRNETLMRAIEWIRETNGLTEEDSILTHDAARPFVTEELIQAHIKALSVFHACDTCIPVSDTIVVSADGQTVSDIPNRSTLYASQTPQSFRAKELWDLYHSLTDAEKEVLTDACRIFTMKGKPVRIIPGDRSNMKITWPGDLALAKTILAERKKGL